MLFVLPLIHFQLNCLTKMFFQMDKSKLYQKLFESFKKSHTITKVQQNLQKLINKF